MIFSERKIDALVRRWKWLVIVGVALVGLSSLTRGPGLVSGMMLAWLGLSAASFQTWRSERGLWWQAGLFAISVGVMLGFSIAGFIADTIHGRLIPDPPGFMLVEGFVWTGILAVHFWFLCAIVRRNRRMTV